MNKLYRCDPDKNTGCKKNNCYRNCLGKYCKHTVDKKYRMRNIFKRIYEYLRY